MAPTELLARAVAVERAKRILVIGLLGSLVFGGWLFFAWRASRLAATECTVQKAFDTPLVGGVLCTVSHRTEGGEEHTLPWEACNMPTRWPKVAPGTKLPCWYYQSSPGEMVFEPRSVVWQAPVRLSGLAFSGIVFLVGLGSLARARGTTSRAPPASHDGAGPYRTPEQPPSPPPAPPAALLSIPLRHSPGWLGWLLALPFVVLGAVLLALTLLLSWRATGEVSVAGVWFVLFAVSVPSAGLAGVGFRSGVVLDRESGLATTWWGLWRPWFSTHRALASLLQADVLVERHRRGTTKKLELAFRSGERATFRCDDEVERLAAQVNAYLAEGERESRVAHQA